MPSSPIRLSRRQVLTASAAVPAAWLSGACTLSRGDRSSGPDTRGPDEDPDVVVLADAVVLVEELVVLLEQTMAERDGVASVVEPLLANHRRHAEVLGAAGPSREESEPPAGSPTGSPTPSSTGLPPDRPQTLPRNRERLLAHLAEREQLAADTHIRQVREATSGQFARLLAAISASESQHATVLQETAA